MEFIDSGYKDALPEQVMALPARRESKVKSYPMRVKLFIFLLVVGIFYFIAVKVILVIVDEENYEEPNNE